MHVYGQARLYTSPEELQGMLHELIRTFDMAYGIQWGELDENYRRRMLGHIVGFEIVADEVEAKLKLSQNRTKEEQANIVAALYKAEDTTVSGVARLMQEQCLGLHPAKKECE